MKIKAAVLVQTGKPLEHWDLEIPALKPGQVLVEIAYSGVCHTQLLETRGYRGEDKFLPHLLGHEGSGVVREVGPDVRKVKSGDQVILSWIKGSGADVPGTVYESSGKRVNSGAITTFSHFSVISENRLTKITDGVSLKQAALIGCALPTGLGSVWNTLQAKPGHSFAVFGAGGVGLAAVLGAVSSGCHPIIAVDINREKLALARELGATHTIDSSGTEPVNAIRELCAGGVDYAVESTGRPTVMAQSIAAVRAQGGRSVIIGNARHGEMLQLDPKEFNQGKQILGTWGGDARPDIDYPRICRLLGSGKMNTQPFSAKSYSLDQINQALEDLEAGCVLRPLIDMSLDR